MLLTCLPFSIEEFSRQWMPCEASIDEIAAGVGTLFRKLFVPVLALISYSAPKHHPKGSIGAMTPQDVRRDDTDEFRSSKHNNTHCYLCTSQYRSNDWENSLQVGYGMGAHRLRRLHRCLPLANVMLSLMRKSDTEGST